jgi:hypothetical protein
MSRYFYLFGYLLIRHAELVSASMPPEAAMSRSLAGHSTFTAWILKQVQDDAHGEWGSRASNPFVSSEVETRPHRIPRLRAGRTDRKDP